MSNLPPSTKFKTEYYGYLVKRFLENASGHDVLTKQALQMYGSDELIKVKVTIEEVSLLDG